MELYKPLFMGQVMPVDDQYKMGDFIRTKYDAFNKIYDTCKLQAGNIDSVSTVDLKPEIEILSIRISTDSATMNVIKQSAPSSVIIEGDVITAGAIKK